MQIRYDHVTYQYSSESAPALQDITLNLDTEHIIGICGVSGSGKSTLIRHLNGLLKPMSGRLLLDGQDIHASADTLREVRRRIAMIFQFPERQLFGRTVEEELSYTLKYHQLSSQEIEQRIVSAAGMMEFDLARYRHRSPFTLSRGEQRKLGITVMLSLQPELLVLDEPTAGMDRRNSQQLLDILQGLHHDKHLALVLVSHNLELLLQYAGYLVVLVEGKVRFVGSPEKLLSALSQFDESGLALPPVTKTLHLLRAGCPNLPLDRIAGGDSIAIIQQHISCKKNLKSD